MYRMIALLFFIMLLAPGISIQTVEADGSGLQRGDFERSIGLEVTHVDVHLASAPVKQFKKEGDNILGGPGSGEGKSNFVMDGYTAPTWASMSPSVFTAESYSFSGGNSAQIDFRTVVANNAGPWPTPFSFAFGWQECGNGTIFPSMPRLYGTSIDGTSLNITLPYSGIWYITVGATGFEPGVYDWVELVDYTGVAPIPVPNLPEDIDALGGDVWNVSVEGALHNLSDEVGDGLASGRPWCFEVLP